MAKILITGGAGFIGSHLVRRFVNKYPEYNVFNLDHVTYAGNLSHLKDVENRSNYTFLHSDIRDLSKLRELFSFHQFDHVIHLAAESHVDRSIESPLDFAQTNVMGTLNLLEAARSTWKREDHRFYQISTDEVYGTLGPSGKFHEDSPYSPRSPYSASKAAADHFVRAYGETYGLPIIVSNCSNNFGPCQFPEKLIPLAIKNFCLRQEVPIYGTGDNIRDWLYVEDHVAAIDLIFHRGGLQETYNVGGECELRNIDLIKALSLLIDERLGRMKGESYQYIVFVKDRLGHDKRYAIDCKKIQQDLNWKRAFSFEEALRRTVDWYLKETDWADAEALVLERS